MNTTAMRSAATAENRPVDIGGATLVYRRFGDVRSFLNA
jgi:hypothetical protein